MSTYPSSLKLFSSATPRLRVPSPSSKGHRPKVKQFSPPPQIVGTWERWQRARTWIDRSFVSQGLFKYSCILFRQLTGLQTWPRREKGVCVAGWGSGEVEIITKFHSILKWLLWRKNLSTDFLFNLSGIFFFLIQHSAIGKWLNAFLSIFSERVISVRYPLTLIP